MRRFAILAFVLTFAAFAQESPKPAPQPQQPEQAKPREITPEQIWGVLMQGNKTFAAGKLAFNDLTQEREALKDHQVPPVTVLSCSDSRVPPELVFNQSLGALFVVRVAGNVADDFAIGSIEFAILNGYTKLIVVLGHDSCGAVKAALGGADPATHGLAELAKRIRMSFIGIPYDSRDAANVRKAVELNARASATQLLAVSKVIRDAVATGQLKVVSAYYDFTTGEVRLLE